jgi:hypothetical protein
MLQLTKESQGTTIDFHHPSLTAEVFTQLTSSGITFLAASQEFCERRTAPKLLIIDINIIFHFLNITASSSSSLISKMINSLSKVIIDSISFMRMRTQRM